MESALGWNVSFKCVMLLLHYSVAKDGPEPNPQLIIMCNSILNKSWGSLVVGTVHKRLPCLEELTHLIDKREGKYYYFHFQMSNAGRERLKARISKKAQHPQIGPEFQKSSAYGVLSSFENLSVSVTW